MHFKLIIIMVEDKRTKKILDTARDAGATGCTVLNQARGEGISPAKTFLGLSIDSQVDVIMLLAEEHMSREILEKVAAAGEFDETPGTGIAFQVDVDSRRPSRYRAGSMARADEDPQTTDASDPQPPAGARHSVRSWPRFARANSARWWLTGSNRRRRIGFSPCRWWWVDRGSRQEVAGLPKAGAGWAGSAPRRESRKSGEAREQSPLEAWWLRCWSTATRPSRPPVP